TGTPLNSDVGLLNVKVSAADRSGASAFDLFALTVANTNDAPRLAHPLANWTAPEAVAFSFNITDGFVDDDPGDRLSYAATLVDGSALPAWLSFDPLTGQLQGTRDNFTLGSMTIEVTATDLSGASTQAGFDLLMPASASLT